MRAALGIAACMACWTALAAATTLAAGTEAAIVLKPGPARGRQLVQTHCALCHSLDYLPANAGILDRKGWEKEVTKMNQAMGLPLEPGELPLIVDYLSLAYGK